MQKEPERSVVQGKLKELYRLIHQCQVERSKSECNLADISGTHKMMQKNSKMFLEYKTKLISLYSECIHNADTEADILRKALNIIHEVRAIHNERRLPSKKSGRPKEAIRSGALIGMLQQSGKTLPLWVGKPNETPPPLCGAMPAEPNYIAKVGDMVSALVDENWILAEVTYYNSSTNTYEVDDIDGKRRDIHVDRSHVIPLPLMRANPETNPEALFQEGTKVLALFPRSTCLYPGVIHKPPSEPNGDYQVLFEDENYETRYSPPEFVRQRYVVKYESIHQS